MDVMQLRRNLMMLMGGEQELWNKKTITVPSNMTTSSDVYNWLNSSGVLPTTYTIFFVIRDNADISTWNDNDFIETSWLKDQNSNITLSRIRSPQSANRYMQGRNPMSNPTDTTTVYQGETFTVFYQ